MRYNIKFKNFIQEKIKWELTCLNGEEILLHKGKTKKSAYVKISEELNPKEQRICLTSHVNLDEELQADTIEIYTKRKVTLHLESNFSHVHGVQWNYTKCFTYAKIFIPWRFILEKQIAN
jgi:hypothetical protein